LKPELEFYGADVDIERMGETQAEGYEIVGKKRLDHIASAGDQGHQGAEVRPDKYAHDDNENERPKISFLQTDHGWFLALMIMVLPARPKVAIAMLKYTNS
jgi:hypothetical protein